MRRLSLLIFALLLNLPLAAQTQYLLTAYSSTVGSVYSSHGLTYVATSWSNSSYNYGVYLVTAPASINPSSVTADSRVLGFEPRQPGAIDRIYS